MFYGEGADGHGTVLAADLFVETAPGRRAILRIVSSLWSSRDRELRPTEFHCASRVWLWLF